MSATQIVRPAGAGHETLAVLAGCALILAVAGTVVTLRAAPAQSHAVAAHQLDARRDLNAAEQGIYADLRIALDEIDAERAGAARLPAVAALADMGLPPFAQDASSAQRGAHAWTLLADGQTQAYLGLSADSAVAASVLLRVAAPAPAHDHAQHAGEDQPDIWMHRSARAAPAALDAAELTRAGWRQVVARFDAGVTRQQR
jgi:hypothetical protein